MWMRKEARHSSLDGAGVGLGRCFPDFEGYSMCDLLLYFSFPIIPFLVGQRAVSRDKWMPTRPIFGSEGYERISFSSWGLGVYVPANVLLTSMCMISFHFHYPVKEIWLNLFSKEATEEVGDLLNITQLVRSLSLGLNPFTLAVPPARPATIWKPFTPSLCFREALWVGIIMMKTTLELKAAFVAAAYDLARFIWLCLCKSLFTPLQQSLLKSLYFWFNMGNCIHEFCCSLETGAEE